MKCSIDDLAEAVISELEDYSEVVAEGLKEDVKDVAKECMQDIKDNSPVRTGKYKKGWRIKTEFESDSDIRLRIHNKTNYQLTHLLEKGHAGRGGTVEGSAPAFPHIEPAEEKAERKLINKAKVRVRQ